MTEGATMKETRKSQNLKGVRSGVFWPSFIVL